MIYPFFHTSQSNPNYGKVLLRFPFTTRNFKTISEAKTFIFNQAEILGCNAILKLTLIKKPQRTGNYIYNEYAYSGDLCLVVKNENSISKEELDFISKNVKNFVVYENKIIDSINQKHLEEEVCRRKFVKTILTIMTIIFSSIILLFLFI